MMFSRNSGNALSTDTFTGGLTCGCSPYSGRFIGVFIHRQATGPEANGSPLAPDTPEAPVSGQRNLGERASAPGREWAVSVPTVASVRRLAKTPPTAVFRTRREGNGCRVRIRTLGARRVGRWRIHVNCHDLADAARAVACRATSPRNHAARGPLPRLHHRGIQDLWRCAREQR